MDGSSRLRKIAHVLNVPIATLSEPAHDTTALTSATELLRCWHDIVSADDRQRLLQFAQELSGRQSDSRSAAE